MKEETRKLSFAIGSIVSTVSVIFAFHYMEHTNDRHKKLVACLALALGEILCIPYLLNHRELVGVAIFNVIVFCFLSVYLHSSEETTKKESFPKPVPQPTQYHHPMESMAR